MKLSVNLPVRVKDVVSIKFSTDGSISYILDCGMTRFIYTSFFVYLIWFQGTEIQLCNFKICENTIESEISSY